MDTIHVLLVEDNDDQAFLLIKQLELAGGAAFDVERASGLQAALDAISQRKPGIVLLDLRLPGVDGLEAFRAINAVCNVPIVILSALHDENLELEAVHEGAQDYIVKGAPVEHIVKSMLYAVERHSHRLTGKAREAATVALGVLQEVAGALDCAIAELKGVGDVEQRAE
jgi:DNA-binding response OmpR family regulator